MHKWTDFEMLKKGYERAWIKIKEEAGEDDRRFLEKAYLVVTSGNVCRQMDFYSSDPIQIAIDNPSFFIRDKNSKVFLGIAGKAREYREGEVDAPEGFFEKFKRCDLSLFMIVDFDVEVRFRSVRIDLIQNVKKSRYCDQTKTDMSKASIAIFLKSVD